MEHDHPGKVSETRFQTAGKSIPRETAGSVKEQIKITFKKNNSDSHEKRPPRGERAEGQQSSSDNFVTAEEVE